MGCIHVPKASDGRERSLRDPNHFTLAGFWCVTDVKITSASGSSFPGIVREQTALPSIDRSISVAKLTLNADVSFFCPFTAIHEIATRSLVIDTSCPGTAGIYTHASKPVFVKALVHTTGGEYSSNEASTRSAVKNMERSFELANGIKPNGTCWHAIPVRFKLAPGSIDFQSLKCTRPLNAVGPQILASPRGRLLF